MNGYTQLQLAHSTEQLSTTQIAHWLNQQQNLNQVRYPNVANAICDWLLQGCATDISTLSQSLWR